MVGRRLALDRRLTVHSRALGRYLEAILDHVTRETAVLDVGTGPGTIPRLVAERATPPVTVVAFDKSWPALDRARATLAGLPRAGVVRASGRRRFPLRSGAFGVVTRRLAPALPEEILRVLAPGGTMVAFTYGARHWGEVYEALPELPRPAQAARDAAEAVQALMEQGFARAEVGVHEESEELAIEDVVLALGAGPAAYFFRSERDEPRLVALSRAQGHAGTLRVTAHYETRVADAPL
jgi:SAM-dependent methyltransferase